MLVLDDCGQFQFALARPRVLWLITAAPVRFARQAARSFTYA